MVACSPAAKTPLARRRQVNDDVIFDLPCDESPAGFEGGDANLYRYVGNMPTMYVDPSGLEMYFRPPKGSNLEKRFKEISELPEDERQAAIDDLNASMAGLASPAGLGAGSLLGRFGGWCKSLLGYGDDAARAGQAAVGAGGALVPKGATPLGRWGESRLAQFLGNRGFKPRSPFDTSLGKRFVDRLVDGIAHESKAGVNVCLNSTTRNQALKDAELIREGIIDGSHWHFWQGADQGLLDFLDNLGIQHTVH